MEYPLQKERFLVLRVVDMILHNHLHAFTLCDVFPTSYEDKTHPGPQPHILGDGTSDALVFHLHIYLVCHSVERVAFGEVSGVEQAYVIGHIPVHVFCLHIEVFLPSSGISTLAAVLPMSLRSGLSASRSSLE